MGMSHVTHSYVHGNESCHTFVCVTRDTHSCTRHVDKSHGTYGYAVSHMWINHVTHTNESCRTNEWVVRHLWISRVMLNQVVESSYVRHDWFICLTVCCAYLHIIFFLGSGLVPAKNHTSFLIHGFARDTLQHTSKQCNTLQQRATYTARYGGWCAGWRRCRECL